jgi:hypothetical protein
MKTFVHITENYRLADRLMKDMMQFLSLEGGICRVPSRSITTPNVLHLFISKDHEYHRLQGLDVAGFLCYDIRPDRNSDLLITFLQSRIRP